MIRPETIKRRAEDPEGISFAALKDQGISLAQAFCGLRWTDYNAHDPGVTILDHLCYGLTDLIYRTGFDCADLLTAPGGIIEYEKLALFHPADVFPNHPVSIEDHRKALFDAVAEVDDIWLRPVPQGECSPPGLYSIHLRLHESLENPDLVEDRGRVCREVRKRFVPGRNLCEDLDDVAIAAPVHFFLAGEIEISGDRHPGEILADIFFRCARTIASGFDVVRYEEVFADGAPLDRIFDGPLTQHGLIRETEAESTGRSISTTVLYGVVRGIEGVVHIRHLRLTDDNGHTIETVPRNPAPNTYYCLRFPGGPGEMRVSLFKHEKPIPVSYADVRLHFDKLEFDYRAFRRNTQDVKGFVNLPEGTYRRFADYISIQNHFPAVYGIGRFGVPESAPATRKAQAKQLKAYLFIFEQFMANFQQQLDDIPHLFSTETEISRTYSSQPLMDSSLPEIEQLYSGEQETNEATIANRLAERVRVYDDFWDRRSRVLDHLLAIHGEIFSQESLRKFNYYYPETDVNRWIIRNKINFVTHIVNIGKYRGAGFDYLSPSWDTENISWLQKKLGILLGLENFKTSRSLCAPLSDDGLTLVPDDRFESRTVSPDSVDLSGAFGLPPDDRAATPTPFNPFDRFPGLDGEISESLFRQGINPENYQIVENDSQSLLYFRPVGEEAIFQLAAFDEFHAAARNAHSLRRFLRRRNLECEGLHLVEHILLRPTTSTASRPVEAPPDFFDFRISVIFPGWTARFHDPNFRLLAEETVCLNCPSHIFPEFIWLDFRRMTEFEQLYSSWLEIKCSDTEETEAVDEASARLLLFLLNNRGREQGKRWV